MRIIKSHWFPLLALLIISSFILNRIIKRYRSFSFSTTAIETKSKQNYWIAPSLYNTAIEPGEDRNLIIYGEQLISKTSFYLGPKGLVNQISNGMNCQNCHLNSGTKPFGNNFGGVYANYPKYRERSGQVEDIYKRISDCFERSLNGTPPDSLSREMQAMAAYINWVGKNVPKGKKPEGVGIRELAFLERSADPLKGKQVYVNNCQSCHGENGEGQLALDGLTYNYPPLWGKNSYNSGAGLFRLSRFAGYVKDNMPLAQDINLQKKLTDEESWDVAAFVNSQPRPLKNLSKDWPNIAAKPTDHPFGPYSDSFTEAQHKYGPFAPIKKWKEINRNLAKK
jgi:thiosulfate dehydrogenase